MKKEYVEPELEVVHFREEDVIMDSNPYISTATVTVTDYMTGGFTT